MADSKSGIPESPEYIAINKSFPKLVNCIEKSPGVITDELIPFEILSEEERSDLRSSGLRDRQKAQKIMDIVMSKVKSEPSFLNDFITILDNKAWTKSYNDELKANLKDEQQRNATIGPNADHITIETPTPVPATADTNHVIDNMPADDIYTSLNKKDVQTVKTKKLFEESDLENETEKIKQKFAVLVINISRALKKEGVTTNDFTYLLSEIGSVHSDNTESNQICYFCDDFMMQIKNDCQSDVGKVFPAIRKCYSWINFGLIESIKDAFLSNNEDIQAKWAAYQTHFKEYCNERVLVYKIPKPINGTRNISKLSQKSNTVVFKIDAEWREMRFDRLMSIQGSIKRLLGLKSHTLYLKTVNQGCVELVFEVPRHVADVIFPPTKEQLQALQEHKIKFCGELKKQLHYDNSICCI